MHTLRLTTTGRKMKKTVKEGEEEENKCIDNVHIDLCICLKAVAAVVVIAIVVVVVVVVLLVECTSITKTNILENVKGKHIKLTHTNMSW